MATGPEHYLKSITSLPLIHQETDGAWAIARAVESLTHATLALAAATAMAARVAPGMHDLDFEAWDRVAGVQEDDPYDAPDAAAPDLITAMGRHSSTHGTAAVYDTADPHDAALAKQARAEYVDYAEAAVVRDIEREMDIDAGDDSEIDRQVAEDDARNERRYEAHEADEAWLDAHPDEFVNDEDERAKEAERDADARDTAWSSTDQVEHDQACEARTDAESEAGR